MDAYKMVISVDQHPSDWLNNMKSIPKAGHYILRPTEKRLKFNAVSMREAIRLVQNGDYTFEFLRTENYDLNPDFSLILTAIDREDEIVVCEFQEGEIRASSVTAYEAIELAALHTENQRLDLPLSDGKDRQLSENTAPTLSERAFAKRPIVTIDVVAPKPRYKYVGYVDLAEGRVSLGGRSQLKPKMYTLLTELLNRAYSEGANTAEIVIGNALRASYRDTQTRLQIMKDCTRKKEFPSFEAWVRTTKIPKHKIERALIKKPDDASVLEAILDLVEQDEETFYPNIDWPKIAGERARRSSNKRD